MAAVRHIREFFLSPHQRLARRRWLMWTGLAVLIWMSLIKFPASPAAALDPSWQMTLGYAALHHLQFGADVVFTYGPLGYLVGATNIGELYGHHLVWQLASNALFAGLIMAVAVRLEAGRGAAYLACVFFLASPFLDTVHLAVILGLSVATLSTWIKQRHALLVAIAALFAVLALVKFTNLLLIVFSLGCIGLHHAWRKRWANLSCLVAGFAGALVVIWMMLGQQPGNLPAFITHSFALSAGYSAAMSLDEPSQMLLLGATSGLGLVICYGMAVTRSSDFPRSLATAFLVAAAAFMNWKHGFVRADTHVLVHFIFCLMLVVTFPLIFPDQIGARRKSGRFLLGLSTVLSVCGIYLTSPALLVDALASWNNRLKEVGYSIASAATLSKAGHAQYTGIRNAHSMPEFKKMAGSSTVDVLGHEQAYAIFNELNFRPRPIFQSYSAYTDKLLRLNRAYYVSERGPEFVLQKMQVFDDRLPDLEDSLASLYVYQHYNYVAQERGFLIWKREKAQSAKNGKAVLTNASVDFGRPFVLPTAGDAPLWVQLDIPSSWLGRIRNLIYKAPIVYLVVTDSAGFQQRYRLVVSMAAAGFLANPHFTSNDQIAKFEAGAPAPRMSSLTVETAPGARKYFDGHVGIRVSTLPPFARHAPSGVKTSTLFSSFNREPSAVNALFPVSVIAEGGRDVLFAHPPSDITFDVNPPAHRVKGGFGLTAGSYTSPNRTDGAEFILEWTGADGRTTKLFNRTLRPAENEADRGRQIFDLALPDEHGRLTLRITPGPANDIACDWTYWSDVQFVE